MHSACSLLNVLMQQNSTWLEYPILLYMYMYVDIHVHENSETFVEKSLGIFNQDTACGQSYAHLYSVQNRQDSTV